ncbi:type I-E CRISPR-associated protein Cas6/Cse3/CasE [Streptomyces sp. NPDC058301]|uniref:type I-E CRISPR-associated protein Cas6/Cse3/CasE n=1 Tax=Streptomyces sp. NPDC058301 TaxID=3346436 RepID=UPI0036E9049D
MKLTATLARIRLNPHAREVQRDLRDAAQMHKTLMRLVADNLGDSPRHQSGLLYRLDETPDTSTLLVQATTPLHSHRLPAGYGHVDIKDLRPMFTALRTGLTVRYRVAVNAAKRERLPLDRKDQRGKIIPLTGPDADQWWMRRATEAGLQLHTVLPTPLPASRRYGEHSSLVRHTLIRYDGTATITNPDTLTTALLEGIGRAKSYGAGLLSLAPATATATATATAR